MALSAGTVLLVLDIMEGALAAGANFMDAASEVNHTILETRKNGTDLAGALKAMKEKNEDDRTSLEEAIDSKR